MAGYSATLVGWTGCICCMQFRQLLLGQAFRLRSRTKHIDLRPVEHLSRLALMTLAPVLTLKRAANHLLKVTTSWRGVTVLNPALRRLGPQRSQLPICGRSCRPRALASRRVSQPPEDWRSSAPPKLERTGWASGRTTRFSTRQWSPMKRFFFQEDSRQRAWQ
jgi:hypothetical protein